MCVAVPGEILTLQPDGTAEVDFGGTRRSVSLALLGDAAVGEFVIVHAGFALHKVDPEEARETLALFREVLGDVIP
ncbi:MAG: HypC/HybG/HupF family hydrogenase formation chaperone [Deferrisomatales bacterium]|nr:HypC/HybG/HupF family hydrogenase formation chaperone [Deferrisomatales bacterium]HSH69533.1 HypC/HybG/HupF family hydrogenase formation chaperone [Deferrisomatales bacterium]